MVANNQELTRICVTCGDEYTERITGMADHSQCYDCEEANRDNSYTGDDLIAQPDCDRDGSVGDATITIKIIGNGNTQTYHICKNCYESFNGWMVK